jgi:hypothetical protein
MAFFRDAENCSLVETYRSFTGTYGIQQQATSCDIPGDNNLKKSSL